MKWPALQRNSRLLFRSYLLIVGGLIVIASVMDFGFQQLQKPAPALSQQWIDGNLTLIESQLSLLPADQRTEAIIELEQQLGFPVRLLPNDHVVQQADTGQHTQEVFDDAGRAVYLRESAKLGSVLQIGPLHEPGGGESALLVLIPPLFYLSIFVFVGLWLWPLVRDLNLLTESAQSFAADYRQPINASQRVTSLRDLAASFDEMAGRIRKLILGQKELTGALSHEMRTPLARIKFAMAMMGNQEQFSEEMISINQDVAEIDQLITAMLDYARLDHSEVEIAPQLTPVDAWMEQVVSKVQVLHPGLQIRQQSGGEYASFDPYLMELVLSNMLVNACRYARKQVLAGFACESGLNTLSVDDDGPGIPEAERQSVFKAFTRLDSSRNRQTGGYGLGLAIVARIAALHRGTARAEASQLGGARILVSWKQAPQGKAA
ncbi:MAG TPA: ATP-binding protein [Xanthomonadales bacterium]|nr:ATP-binding protein [Xanthomonadales bacterium]